MHRGRENTLTNKENRKRVHTRVPKVTAERLEHDANRHGITVSALLNQIVEERYGLRGKCPAEVFRGTTYICVWGRQKNTPKIGKLAETVQEKNDICRACKRTLDLVMRAETAETMLGQERVIEIPACTGGAEVRDAPDGTIQLFCMNPDYGAYKWRNSEFCKTANNGEPCLGHKVNRITVQGTKTKDMR